MGQLTFNINGQAIKLQCYFSCFYFSLFYARYTVVSHEIFTMWIFFGKTKGFKASVAPPVLPQLCHMWVLTVAYVVFNRALEVRPKAVSPATVKGLPSRLKVGHKMFRNLPNYSSWLIMTDDPVLERYAMPISCQEMTQDHWALLASHEAVGSYSWSESPRQRPTQWNKDKGLPRTWTKECDFEHADQQC